ncbi:MAG: cytochrome c oxidase subunit II [Candidatus Hydrogenedentes bacterium]|nr:cytochrome c oxidase subunit II [Candidatus Hydrogenedentota bacterium]
MNFPLIPEQASTFAPNVDLMFYALTAFVGLFTIGITGVVIFLGIKYKAEPGRKSVHMESMKLELLWTVIPAIIALGIFVWGAIIYFDYQNIPENTLDINVIGKQWMWKIQHGNGKREVNELHVPVNKAVKLTMTSQDVIHDFYIPAFRVKQDVLPAKYTEMWFEATKVGTYPVFCAEYCGTQHSTMDGIVVVMEQDDYQEWLQGGPPVTPAQAGEPIFQQMGCITCHDAGAASRGPILNGVFGREVALRGGETVVADEEYIRESIMTPSAKIADGYAPLMPTFPNLDEEDILNIIAYIKSLSDEQQ